MTKKILITGKNSYIGRSFMEYCKKKDVDFEIDELDVRGNEWKSYDFSIYDVVYHLAGIAHIKETKENHSLYYEVNRDLAIEVAEKAKNQNVNHFIFMSTMSVYGLSEGYIDKSTSPNPKSAYGKSKLQAEEKIETLNDNEFIVSIIRPPMIYGPGSKGNYSLLSKLSKRTKIFPVIENKRSMLFIDNLSEFISRLIICPSSIYFHPQNKEFVNTYEMVKEIAKNNKNHVFFTKIFNPLFTLKKIVVFNKVFGTLIYDKNLSNFDLDYNQIGFKESIMISEED